MNLRFVADENVPPAVVRALRESGYAVQHVLEDGPGASDSQVVASAGDAILMTQDIDLGYVVYRRRDSVAGVILLRFPGTPATEIATVVLEAVREHGDSLLGSFSVVSRNRLRIRRF